MPAGQNRRITTGEYVSPEEVKRKAKKGDVIEFNRGLYSHYALSLGAEGDHMLINVCAEDKNYTSAVVRLLPFDQVCEDTKEVRISNHESEARRRFKVGSRDPDRIVHAACQFLERSCEYQFTRRNCEYYCMLWRYGVGFSTQVANGLALKWLHRGVRDVVLPVYNAKNAVSIVLGLLRGVKVGVSPVGACVSLLLQVMSYLFEEVSLDRLYELVYKTIAQNMPSARLVALQ